MQLYLKMEIHVLHMLVEATATRYIAMKLVQNTRIPFYNTRKFILRIRNQISKQTKFFLPSLITQNLIVVAEHIHTHTEETGTSEFQSMLVAKGPITDNPQEKIKLK